MLKHAFVSGKADGGDATLVQPSNWNADHVVDVFDLPNQGSTTTPAAGNLRMYSLSDDGVVRLEYKTPDGETVRLGRDQILTVRNNTGSTLNKGQLVYISGANVQRIRVSLARADSDNTMPAIGMMLDTLANGSDGRCSIGGIVAGLNTSGYTDGDRIFLSSTTAGSFTATPPSSGFKQRVGFVINANASNGIVLVAPAGASPRQDLEGYLWLQDDTLTPATPTDGVVMFARSIAGGRLPAFVGPSGLDSALQPLLARNKVGFWCPPGNATTAPGVLGFTAFTATGTATARNVATTSAFTRMRRLGYVSAATAASLAGARVSVAQITLGTTISSIVVGGFRKVIRFGCSDAATVAGARQFVGISSSTAAPTNVEPSTLTNSIGVGHGTADSTLSIYFGGSAAQTPISLGANFPANTLSVDIYELALFCAPGSTTVGWQVTRLNTGDAASGTLTGTVGTQLPAVTTLLTYSQNWRTNNATALAVGLDIFSDYIETDQ
jgi:hypothetical protein